MKHAIRNQQLEPKFDVSIYVYYIFIYTWEAIPQVVGEEIMKRGRSGASHGAAIAQCMPRPWPRRQGRTMAARPAATLLERLREVVIKLVMFSAISPARRPASAGGGRERQPCCNREDPRRSEAVEDCIEFIRMSSSSSSSSTEGPTKS